MRCRLQACHITTRCLSSDLSRRQADRSAYRSAMRWMASVLPDSTMRHITSGHRIPRIKAAGGIYLDRHTPHNDRKLLLPMEESTSNRASTRHTPRNTLPSSLEPSPSPMKRAKIRRLQGEILKRGSQLSNASTQPAAEKTRSPARSRPAFPMVLQWTSPPRGNLPPPILRAPLQHKQGMRDSGKERCGCLRLNTLPPP